MRWRSCAGRRRSSYHGRCCGGPAALRSPGGLSAGGLNCCATGSPDTAGYALAGLLAPWQGGVNSWGRTHAHRHDRSGYVGLSAAHALPGSAMPWPAWTSTPTRSPMRDGRMPIFEPGSPNSWLRRRGGPAHVCDPLAPAVGRADVVFIAVGTPSVEGAGSRLRYVFSAAEAVGRAVSALRWWSSSRPCRWARRPGRADRRTVNPAADVAVAQSRIPARGLRHRRFRPPIVSSSHREERARRRDGALRARKARCR